VASGATASIANKHVMIIIRMDMVYPRGNVASAQKNRFRDEAGKNLHHREIFHKRFFRENKAWDVAGFDTKGLRLILRRCPLRHVPAFV
jgi:hypothetical protein